MRHLDLGICPFVGQMTEHQGPRGEGKKFHARKASFPEEQTVVFRSMKKAYLQKGATRILNVWLLRPIRVDRRWMVWTAEYVWEGRRHWLEELVASAPSGPKIYQGHC